MTSGNTSTILRLLRDSIDGYSNWQSWRRTRDGQNFFSAKQCKEARVFYGRIARHLRSCSRMHFAIPDFMIFYTRNSAGIFRLGAEKTPSGEGRGSEKTKDKEQPAYSNSRNNSMRSEPESRLMS